MKSKDKVLARKRRHFRIRNKVSGTSSRPRMNIFKSNKNLYVQFIDDHAGVTLAAVSTLNSEMKNAKPNVETAKKIGELAASKAKEKGIEEVVFDRGGFQFTGCVEAIATSAREAGLKF